MARSLTRLPHHLTAASTRLRCQSTLPNSPAIPKKGTTKEDVERAALKKLEDAVHRIIVKRAQPDWLPLVPGASYWVPPKSKARGFAQVVEKLAKDSTNAREVMKSDKALASRSNRGWPSSAHFFQGTSHCPEGETSSKHTNKTEEEEG